MENLTICFDFAVTLTIQNRKGRVYRSHREQAMGLRYEDAIWSIYFKLKKRGTQILGIVEARPVSIAFAFDRATLERVKVTLADCTPCIPDDLNQVLASLPKKK